MWWKSWKKRENALLEKNLKVIFSTFFLLKLSQSNPILGFYNKKAKKCSLHTCIFKIGSKNGFLLNNYLRVLKLSKQKNFENFQIFFLYSVQDAPCDSRRKFHADWRIFKHCQKSAKMSVTIVTRWRQRVKLKKRLKSPPCLWTSGVATLSSSLSSPPSDLPYRFLSLRYSSLLS